MSKQINIGGRLHSTEQGNVITGANEILDDTKGKKQNVINADVDAELLRLDQSKQNNLTFDNTPTENSTNPVTSGGVYAANITLHELIEAILVLIPSAASALNQLADKAFVNSSVSTATATFRGTYNVVTDLELAYDATHEQIATKLGQVIATADNNDYAFVQVPVSATSTDIRRTERYKFNGTVWGYEYDLNTSGFTAAQWEAINSGITALLVSKLTNLPTAEVLATMFNAKQNVLTFDSAPAALSTNPVYSGGVYTAIKAITDLIPSEATALNQLADKAYVLASILAATPAFKGQFTSLVDLQAVSSPKAGDIGIVRTKDNDGKDVFTFYQYLNNQWNVYFSLSYHPQTKPASTGTTGAYPYNGMGRVVIPKKMVNSVNTLTHEAFEDSEGNDRENTIYVIQYDFVLGEDITVPENCILEFDGGSISGNGTGKNTITGTNTQIIAQDVAIFNNGIVIAGTWACPRIPSDWFDDVTSDNRVNQLINLTSSDIYNNIILKENEYHVSITTNDTAAIVPKSNTKIELYGTIKMTPNAFHNSYIIVIDDDTENIEISGKGEIVGYYLLSELGTGRNWGHGIFIYEARNITIKGITFRNCSGDGIAVGRDGKNPCTNVLIDGCTFYECYRQGISVICVNGLIIRGNYIYNIFGGYSYAIDIEPNTSNTTYNIIIENNIIKNKKGINVEPHAHYLAQDIVIKNNDITYSKYHGVHVDLGESIIVANNSFTKVDLSDTNPTDTDSEEYTPFAIETTRSDARGMMLFENNHISGKGADSLSSTWNLVNAKYGTFRNNRFLGSYAVFENCTLENNKIQTYQENTFNNCYLLHNTLDSQNGSLSFIITSGSSDFIGNIFLGTNKLLIAGLDGNGVSANFEGNIIKNGLTRAFCRVNGGISADKLVFRNNNIDLSYPVIYMGNYASISLKTIIPEVNNIGSSRPTLNANYAGFEFFDTTLGKPIYWNGTKWIKSDGTDA